MQKFIINDINYCNVTFQKKYSFFKLKYSVKNIISKRNFEIKVFKLNLDNFTQFYKLFL